MVNLQNMLITMEILVKRCLGKAFYSSKFLMTDLHVADYELFHPEIATIETLIEAPSMKEFFSSGNLTQMQCILSSAENGRNSIR